MEEYEPYAIAAFPIQAPVPILQFLSPSAYSGKYKKPPKKTQNVRDLHAYPSNIVQGYQNYQNYAPYTYNHIFEDQPKYPKREQYETDTAPLVIYARPNKNGGYTYRKPTSSSFKQQKEKEPIIIRIHKYRVIH